MTNHVHLLATPSTPESLPKTMQWTFGRYVAYFNGRCGRTGTLLQGRYRATVVDDEHYLLTCMRYIELNPVRAGIASGPGEYAWSSFHANATGESDDLLTPHAVFRSLGGTRAERAATYLALFREVLAEADLDLIRDATHHGWAIGRSTFAERIAAASRRAHRLSSGRRPSQRGPST
jgi:putative transposase